MLLSSINHSLIKLALVSSLIHQQQANGAKEFTDLKSTRPSEQNIGLYHTVTDEYIVDAPLKKVFNHYVSANPSEAWSGGDLVQFGLALSKNTGEVFYPGSDYPGAELGHVFYIHVSFWGLKKLCMAHEIVEVDQDKGRIVFSYIEGGQTEGMQEMTFEELDNQTTKITHTSTFKGLSAFRDKYLYPYFHSMIVSRFHENLAASLK